MNSNIIKLNIISIIRNASFLVTPIIVLFWQDNGLSLTEIMLLQSIFAFVILFSELPTGAFADIFGRKKSLIIGHILTIIGVVFYALGHNFLDFVVAEIFFGLGIAFISGADSAILYDTLLELKKEKFYKKIYGAMLSYTLIATSVGVIIGGFIGQFNMRLTLFIQIPILFVALLVSLTLSEPHLKKRVAKKNNFIKHILKSFRFAIIKNKETRWLIVYFGLIGAFQSIMLWLYQPYMAYSSLDIKYFGLVFAIYGITAAIASKYAHLIENKIGRKISLILPMLLISLGFFLFSSIVWIYGALFGLLFQFVRGFAQPVMSDYINQIVWSEKRASVLSISSMFKNILFATISPFIGYVADVYSLQQSLLLSGAIVLFSCTILLLLMINSRVFTVKNI